MKNRLDYKLTLSLVSLFVSAILLVIGGILKNGFCLCFGLCFSALAMIFFSINQYAKINETLQFLQQELQSDELPDGAFYEYTAQIKAVKKQRKQVIWGGFAFSIVLIILGIACAV